MCTHQAALLSSSWSGFQGLFFGRAGVFCQAGVILRHEFMKPLHVPMQRPTDAQNIAQRRNTTSMEMIWMGSRSLGASAATFTGINDNLYQPPPGFCCELTAPTFIQRKVGAC
jgi:hypothetical protein